MNTVEYYTVENTGWSGGVSWFPSKRNQCDEWRFDTRDEAMEYIRTHRWDDDSVMWRMTFVTYAADDEGYVETVKYIKVD